MDKKLRLVASSLQRINHAFPLHTQGITPLFIACQERHVSVVRALLRGKADPNKRNKVGRDLVDYVRLVQIHADDRARMVGCRWPSRRGKVMCQ